MASCDLLLTKTLRTEGMEFGPTGVSSSIMIMSREEKPNDHLEVWITVWLGG